MKSNHILLFNVLFTVLLLTGCSASSSSFAAADPVQEPAAQTASYETVSAVAAETQTPLSQTAPKTEELPLIVMVKDELYLYTGSPSIQEVRCGMMDGQITSAVAQDEIPSQNDQSNFGTGYGYQYGEGSSIDIYMPEQDSNDMIWLRFVKANPFGEKKTEPLPSCAPAMTLKNYFTDLTDSLVTDSLLLTSGNYSWICTGGDETTSQIACGTHPLDEANLHPSMLILSTRDFPHPTYSFSFTGGLSPDSLIIRKWSRDDIGNHNASPLSTAVYVSPLPLLELRDGYVYEITAEWKEENAAENGCFGIASYVVVTQDELYDPVTPESCSGLPLNK